MMSDYYYGYKWECVCERTQSTAKSMVLIFGSYVIVYPRMSTLNQNLHF